ncbi:hypothetical protein ACA910_021752 [Epithemia clementina (nom. ined.)]
MPSDRLYYHHTFASRAMMRRDLLDSCSEPPPKQHRQRRRRPLPTGDAASSSPKHHLLSNATRRNDHFRPLMSHHRSSEFCAISDSMSLPLEHIPSSVASTASAGSCRSCCACSNEARQRQRQQQRQRRRMGHIISTLHDDDVSTVTAASIDGSENEGESNDFKSNDDDSCAYMMLTTTSADRFRSLQALWKQSQDRTLASSVSVLRRNRFLSLQAQWNQTRNPVSYRPNVENSSIMPVATAAAQKPAKNMSTCLQHTSKPTKSTRTALSNVDKNDTTNACLPAALETVTDRVSEPPLEASSIETDDPTIKMAVVHAERSNGAVETNKTAPVSLTERKSSNLIIRVATPHHINPTPGSTTVVMEKNTLLLTESTCLQGKLGGPTEGQKETYATHQSTVFVDGNRSKLSRCQDETARQDSKTLELTMESDALVEAKQFSTKLAAISVTRKTKPVGTVDSKSVNKGALNTTESILYSKEGQQWRQQQQQQQTYKPKAEESQLSSLPKFENTESAYVMITGKEETKIDHGEMSRDGTCSSEKQNKLFKTEESCEPMDCEANIDLAWDDEKEGCESKEPHASLASLEQDAPADYQEKEMNAPQATVVSSSMGFGNKEDVHQSNAGRTSDLGSDSNEEKLHAMEMSISLEPTGSLAFSEKDTSAAYQEKDKGTPKDMVASTAMRFAVHQSKTGKVSSSARGSDSSDETLNAMERHLFLEPAGSLACLEKDTPAECQEKENGTPKVTVVSSSMGFADKEYLLQSQAGKFSAFGSDFNEELHAMKLPISFYRCEEEDPSQSHPVEVSVASGIDGETEIQEPEDVEASISSDTEDRNSHSDFSSFGKTKDIGKCETPDNIECEQISDLFGHKRKQTPVPLSKDDKERLRQSIASTFSGEIDRYSHIEGPSESPVTRSSCSLSCDETDKSTIQATKSLSAQKVRKSDPPVIRAVTSAGCDDGERQGKVQSSNTLHCFSLDQDNPVHTPILASMPGALNNDVGTRQDESAVKQTLTSLQTELGQAEIVPLWEESKLSSHGEDVEPDSKRVSNGFSSNEEQEAENGLSGEDAKWCHENMTGSYEAKFARVAARTEFLDKRTDPAASLRNNRTTPIEDSRTDVTVKSSFSCDHLSLDKNDGSQAKAVRTSSNNQSNDIASGKQMERISEDENDTGSSGHEDRLKTIPSPSATSEHIVSTESETDLYLSSPSPSDAEGGNPSLDACRIEAYKPVAISTGGTAMSSCAISSSGATISPTNKEKCQENENCPNKSQGSDNLVDKEKVESGHSDAFEQIRSMENAIEIAIVQREHETERISQRDQGTRLSEMGEISVNDEVGNRALNHGSDQAHAASGDGPCVRPLTKRPADILRQNSVYTAESNDDDDNHEGDDDDDKTQLSIALTTLPERSVGDSKKGRRKEVSWIMDLLCDPSSYYDGMCKGNGTEYDALCEY